jgi:hypothetical protein
MNTTQEVTLPSLDDLVLATEKLAIGSGALDEVAVTVARAVDPNSPPAISLEQAGALLLYALDCERAAEEIRGNATKLRRDVEALFWAQPTEENLIGGRAMELVEAWHRDCLKGSDPS